LAREERTTKKRAQRIDLNYFKRPHPLRRMRFWLSVGVPILAVLWLAWYGFAGSNRLYSGGKMSAAHAVLTAKCDACHVRTASSFSAKASDQACVSCHDGPIHHANQVFTPQCSSCHEEHRGRMRLGATADVSCTQCHADLRTSGAPTKYVRDIDNFGDSHPEFAALRPGAVDPGTIKLNHAIHLKKNLKGPNGEPVQMDCGDCHRPPTSTQPLRFGTATTAALTIVQKSDLPIAISARAYMAPVTYAQHCAACHGLQFDKRFTDGVPHDTPQVIHAFLIQRFQQYIAKHPGELRETGPDRTLPQKPVPVAYRIVTPSQWVAERVGESEELLWRKTCKQCHGLTIPSDGSLPTVAKSSITARWMPHADFNHERHQLLQCTECHGAALTSHETADILLPGIKTCERCHNSSADGAESRCFECHTYHDWTKQKDVKGKLMLDGLGRGQ
jgi:hypothetical protein